MDSFQRDGHDIAYEVHGSGVSVVLVHGVTVSFAGNYGAWGWPERLNKLGYQVIRMDLRGHGKSSKPHDPAAYGTANLASDGLALMDHLGHRSVSLIGYPHQSRDAGARIMLPFTHEQFLDVFARYNVAVWPMQVVVYVLAAAMIAVLVRPGPLSGRLIGGGLAAMWLWTGIGYHWMFFAGINRAAWLFGALFVAQGLLLLVVTVVRYRLRFSPSNNLSSWLGWGFVAYALVIYPLVGLATGSEYPGMPMFGITPCPVTLFTFGLFLLASSAIPWWLLVMPLIWSLVGGSAAVLLHVPQDWFLLFSGIAVVPIILRGRRQHALATA